MQCPKCQSLETEVVKTEPRQHHTRIYRRHFCYGCSSAFNSIQLTETQARKLNKAILALEAIAAEKHLHIDS